MTEYEWIDRKEYPFESRYFKTPTGRMHYIDEGGGSPIVMVHGNPTWSFLYRNLIKQLRTEYRCIAMDHIGFGLSDKPRVWSYLPEDHAKNLEAFIEHLELENNTLIMQDWGGPIGMSYAVNNPSNVSRFILMNTWAWPVNRDLHYIGFSSFMGGFIGRFLIRRYNFFARSVMKQVFGDKSKLPPEIHDHYLKPLDSPETRTGSHVFPKQIIGSTSWLNTIWSRISVLCDIPALFVWGMKDIAFREKELRRWEQTFSNSRSVRLRTVGHYVQEEAPDELSDAVIPFLTETTQ